MFEESFDCRSIVSTGTIGLACFDMLSSRSQIWILSFCCHPGPGLLHWRPPFTAYAMERQTFSYTFLNPYYFLLRSIFF